MKEENKLEGCNILLTREHSQVASLSRMLLERGASTIECPTIAFSPPHDWSSVDQYLSKLAEYAGLIFTSVNAVKFFFMRLNETGGPSHSIKEIPCFAIGPATAKALAARNITVKALPDKYQAEGLVDLLEKQDFCGKKILFPRARDAREVLIRSLEARGIQVDLAVVYETRKAQENQERLRQVLATESLDYLTFTSTSTVRFFIEMAGPKESSRRSWRSIPAACIGEITADTTRDLGFSTVLSARKATLTGLVDTLVEYESRKNRQ